MNDNAPRRQQTDDRGMTGNDDTNQNRFREEGRLDAAGQVSTPPQTQPVGSTIPDKADPSIVAPSSVSGGIGGPPTDGTQVPHHVPTAVPGKPMAPIASAEGGVDDITPTMDPPSGTHAERGGSG